MKNRAKGGQVDLKKKKSKKMISNVGRQDSSGWGRGWGRGWGGD